MDAGFNILVSRISRVVVVAALLGMAGSASGKITFERAYGGELWDQGFSVQQTSDGGYVVTGWADYDNDLGPIYVYLLKTDSLGDTLWSRVWGAGLNGTQWYGRSVRQTMDGGYIVAGKARPIPWGTDEFYFAKTDSLGEIEWEKICGGDNTDIAADVRQTADGGYIVVGHSCSFSPFGLDETYLIKTNAQGDVTWWRTHGGNYHQYGDCVQQTSDGRYIIAGGIAYSPGTWTDILLTKTDSQGIPMWTKTYGPSGKVNIGGWVEQTRDGGYIVCGSIDCWENPRAYVVKTDAYGDSLWSRTYSKQYGVGSQPWRVGQTYDGGYFVVGKAYTSSGDAGVLLIRTDSLGMVLWDTTFGTPDHDWSEHGCQTSDSGYVITGFTAHFGVTPYDVYLVKTNDRGRVIPERDGATVRIDLPPDTVYTDSVYQVKATVKNLGNVLDRFEVSVTLDGYNDIVMIDELDPGSSIEVSFADWRVPPDDSTTYTMTVCTHAEDDVDTTNDCKQKTIFAYNPTGVEELSDRRGVPFDFCLWQNEPNPFHRSTAIWYSLPASCDVTLKVYDAAGRPVTTLVSKEQGPGVHSVTWDGEAHASGVYFYRLEAGGFTDTRKMVLAR